MRDFSANKYEQLCIALLNHGYKFLTLEDYIKIQQNISGFEKIVVMRHDLCRDAHIGTYGLLAVENKLDIKTTYYFRNPESFDLKVIADVADRGHEIGVHFDCLDKAHGDINEAFHILEQDLKILNTIYDVKTISMHGNPSTKWDNRDIFRYFNFEDFNILGEAYLSVDFTKIWYFTDTGRNWTDSKNNVKDTVDQYGNNQQSKPDFHTTDELIKSIPLLNNNLYFLVHPNRWRGSFSGWLWKLVMDFGKNRVKALYKWHYSSKGNNG